MFNKFSKNFLKKSNIFSNLPQFIILFLYYIILLLYLNLIYIFLNNFLHSNIKIKILYFIKHNIYSRDGTDPTFSDPDRIRIQIFFGSGSGRIRIPYFTGSIL